MSTTSPAMQVLIDFLAAGKDADSALVAYDQRAEAAVKADLPMLIATKEVSVTEAASSLGLSETATNVHIATLEAAMYENDMKPHELRTIMWAAHSCKGVSLSALRKEIKALPDNAKRSDCYRLVRKAIDATVQAKVAEAKRAEKTPELPHKTLTRAASTASNVKSVGDDVAATLAALTLMEAECKRIRALVVSALTVTTIDAEAPATVTV